MGALNNSMWNSKSGEDDFYEHQISNSVRFNSGTPNLLHRTPASAGNRQVGTVSLWMKSSYNFIQSANANLSIFVAGTSGNQTDALRVLYMYQDFLRASSTEANFNVSSDKLRDPAAWFHLVAKLTGGNLVHYVNGVQVSTHSVSGDTALNDDVAHIIGSRATNGPDSNFEGYMTEVCVIDGTAHGPDSFGETKEGMWIPKDPSGLTFGSQGAYLQMKNSAVGTASANTMGADTSGNNNHFTTVGFAASDHMKDSPTFGEDSDGNFCVMNTIGLTGLGTAAANHTDTTEGGLAVHVDAGGGMGTMGLHSSTGGKWYWEVRIVTYQDGGILGITNDTFNSDVEIGYNSPASGLLADAIGYYFDNGNLLSGVQDGGTTSSYGAKVAAGDIIGIAVDVDNGKIWFAENNSFQNSGNPATGANAARGASGTIGAAMDFTTATWFPAVGDWSAADADVVFNFGQDGTFAGAISAAGNADGNGNGSFKYAPPSGYLALCTANLPTPAADPKSGNPPSKFFSPYIWTGNGQNRNITIASDKKPSLTWIKQTTDGTLAWNVWTHAYVGFNGDPDSFLVTNTTALISADQGTSGPFTAAPSATALPISVYANVNANTKTYVGYAWSMNGGSNSTNEEGSVDSEVDANATVGQSIVAWTGTNNSFGNAITVGHGLDAAPHMIVVKQLTGNADEWNMYHHAVGPGSGSTAAHSSLTLNSNAALYSNQSYKGFGGTLPTATVFTVDGNNLNRASATLFALCCTSKDGYSRFGRFEGNGNANGTFVNCGFQPATIWLKSIDSTSDWLVYDNKRLGYNVDNNSLSINSTASQTTTDMVDIVSNGFKARIATDPNVAETYIYCAWAEAPFKYAVGR